MTQGDCYDAAVDYMQKKYLRDPDCGLILVHAEVTGQGPISGIRYGHAFVLDGDLVIDVSNNRGIKMPKALYYHAGKIGDNLYEYTYPEMIRKLVEYQHYGPWDLETGHEGPPPPPYRTSRKLRRYRRNAKKRLPIAGKESHYWTGEPLEVPKRPKSQGYILYEGPSRYDEKPIVVIATGFIRPSDNRKTGRMIQTYILRSDMHPVDAWRAGEDKSICGRCEHLGTLIPGMGKPPSKRSRTIASRTKRSCYVRLDFLGNVYRRYKANKYIKLHTTEDIENVFKNTPFPPRIGSYGDPAMVPLNIWKAVVKFKQAWTGYTAQWRIKRVQKYKPYLQASVCSYKEYYEAKKLGWSTYRVGRQSEPKLPTETYCPYTAEGGGGVQCCNCTLCMGTTVMRHGKKSKDILTRPHGVGSQFYEERGSRRRNPRRRRKPIEDEPESQMERTEVEYLTFNELRDEVRNMIRHYRSIPKAAAVTGGIVSSRQLGKYASLEEMDLRSVKPQSLDKLRAVVEAWLSSGESDPHYGAEPVLWRGGLFSFGGSIVLDQPMDESDVWEEPHRAQIPYKIGQLRRYPSGEGAASSAYTDQAYRGRPPAWRSAATDRPYYIEAKVRADKFERELQLVKDRNFEALGDDSIIISDILGQLEEHGTLTTQDIIRNLALGTAVNILPLIDYLNVIGLVDSGDIRSSRSTSGAFHKSVSLRPPEESLRRNPIHKTRLKGALSHVAKGSDLSVEDIYLTVGDFAAKHSAKSQWEGPVIKRLRRNPDHFRLRHEKKTETEETQEQDFSLDSISFVDSVSFVTPELKPQLWGNYRGDRYMIVAEEGAYMTLQRVKGGQTIEVSSCNVSDITSSSTSKEKVCPGDNQCRMAGLKQGPNCHPIQPSEGILKYPDPI